LFIILKVIYLFTKLIYKIIKWSNFKVNIQSNKSNKETSTPSQNTPIIPQKLTQEVKPNRNTNTITIPNNKSSTIGYTISPLIVPNLKENNNFKNFIEISSASEKPKKKKTNTKINYIKNEHIDLDKNYESYQKCQTRTGLIYLLRNTDKLPLQLDLQPVFGKIDLVNFNLYLNDMEKSKFYGVNLMDILKISKNPALSIHNCFNIILNHIDNNKLLKGHMTICFKKLTSMTEWMKTISEFKECQIDNENNKKDNRVLVDFAKVNKLIVENDPKQKPIAKTKIVNGRVVVNKGRKENTLYYDNTNTMAPKNPAKDAKVDKLMKKIVDTITSGAVQTNIIKRKMQNQLKKTIKAADLLQKKRNLIQKIVNRRIEVENQKKDKLLDLMAKKKEIRLLNAVKSRIVKMKKKEVMNYHKELKRQINFEKKLSNVKTQEMINYLTTKNKTEHPKRAARIAALRLEQNLPPPKIEGVKVVVPSNKPLFIPAKASTKRILRSGKKVKVNITSVTPKKGIFAGVGKIKNGQVVKKTVNGRVVYGKVIKGNLVYGKKIGGKVIYAKKVNGKMLYGKMKKGKIVYKKSLQKRVINPSLPNVTAAGTIVKKDGSLVKLNGTIIKPDGTIKKRNGTIIKPDGTKVKPNGTIVKPNGTKLKKDGTIVKPNGTIIKKNGIVIKTDGTVKKPDGTVIKPDGKIVKEKPRPNIYKNTLKIIKRSSRIVVKPNGTIVKPNGTIIKKSGTVIKPDGTVKKPDGTIIRPNGKKEKGKPIPNIYQKTLNKINITTKKPIVKPNGNIVKSNGTIIKKDGTIIKPNGTVKKPDGTIIRPNGKKEKGKPIPNIYQKTLNKINKPTIKRVTPVAKVAQQPLISARIVKGKVLTNTNLTPKQVRKMTPYAKKELVRRIERAAVQKQRSEVQIIPGIKKNPYAVGSVSSYARKVMENKTLRNYDSCVDNRILLFRNMSYIFQTCKEIYGESVNIFLILSYFIIILTLIIFNFNITLIY